jgi:hypothetical protein
MSIYQKLNVIQAKLNVPKNQFNQFGKYNYRSCEDILEAVKPLLGGLSLLLCDEIVLIGDRYYLKATATLTDGTETVSVAAYAREENEKKGMDSAQLTGATSSYARKYALAGLFLLDDNKDADTMDNSKQDKKQDKPGKQEFKESNPPDPAIDDMRREMAEWFTKKYGTDALTHFKEFTGGTFENPLTIKTPRNVEICWKNFNAMKEAPDA